MKGPYAKQWKEVMDKQMQSFATMGTWKLVPRPENTPVLTGKWVYKIKKKLDASTKFTQVAKTAAGGIKNEP